MGAMGYGHLWQLKSVDFMHLGRSHGIAPAG